MPRPTSFPIQIIPFVGQLDETQVTRTVPYLENSTGINKRITTEQMSPNDASELENFYFNEAGKLQTRGGTLVLGSVDATENVIHIARYERGDKRSYLVRWLEDTVEYYYAGAWTAFAGAAIGFSSTQRVYHASWGPNTLLFVGNSKVYALDFSAFTVAQVAASPSNSQHIHVYGNRVCVSAPGTNYTRVQWSVKNDYTDWTGDGSGFEDIVPGPTGAGDRVLGGYAISDTEVLIIRSNSVWTQVETGQVDAPFVFRFLYPVKISSLASAAVAPGGVFVLGDSDVYFLTSSKPDSIGDQISNKYIEDTSNDYGVAVTDPAGAYDEFRKVYYLSLPLNVADDTGELLVYHQRNGGWTTFKYPITVNRICTLNAPIDYNTPNTYFIRGPILTQMGGGDARVIYEDPATSTDIIASGSSEDLVAFATMGALKPTSWERRVKFESLTIDINGGSNSQLTASVTLFAPSKYNDITFETITIASNVFIQTNKLRQRQSFFGVRERNGIVPKVTFTASPMVALNAIYVSFSDGSLFVPTTVTATSDRIAVDLTGRITVDGTGRITV